MANQTEHCVVASPTREAAEFDSSGAQIPWNQLGKMDYDRIYQEEDDWIDKQLAITAALPKGEIKGALLSWSVGDGHAFYLVSDDKPVTLTPVHQGDNYQVDPALIRGLRKADVVQLVEQVKSRQALFGKRVGSTTI